MVIPYDSNKVLHNLFTSWTGTAIKRTVTTKFWWFSLTMFASIGILANRYMEHSYAEEFKGVASYAAATFGALFTYQITWYNGNCYTRFDRSWLAGMTGMARLNDLGVQVYSHLCYDHGLCCEVIRLMHLANHLLYFDFAVVPAWDVVERRNLVTRGELEFLRSIAVRDELMGLAPWYQAASWALRLVSREVHSGRLQPALGLALDRTICQWRQNTTLPPLIQQTPIPLPYYHLMIFELIMFHLVLSCRLALELTPEDGRIPIGPLAWSTVAYILITLTVDSMLWAAIIMSEAWGDDPSDLPAGLFLVTPWVSHRALFAGAVDDDRGGPALDDDERPLFLKPLAEVDQLYVESIFRRGESCWATQKRVGAQKFPKEFWTSGTTRHSRPPPLKAARVVPKDC